MGYSACFEFGEKNLTQDNIKNKDIIEVGSHEDGGSLRGYVESYAPKSYLGIDLQMGPGVDVVCDASDLLELYGKESFDVLIANELIEHIRNWQKIIHIFKNILRPNGILIITTRSKGFPFHYAPFDFWRFEISDMEQIFSDFIIESIESDPRLIKGKPAPGVFIAAKKPMSFEENDLIDYKLWSILQKYRIKKTNNLDIFKYEFFHLGIPYFIRFNGIPFLLREFFNKNLSDVTKNNIKKTLRLK